MPTCAKCNRRTFDGTRWNSQKHAEFNGKYVCSACQKEINSLSDESGQKLQNNSGAASGVMLKCKKIFGQFLLTEKPLVKVNGGKDEQLEWNKEFLISLQPDVPYTISVQFPYMGRFCGTASFDVKVNSGEIHLWAHTVSGYSSHLIVYVSNDYSNWYTTFNGYITNSNPYDINCGSYNNFRYIGVCVNDDQGWSANVCVDAVHVSG